MTAQLRGFIAENNAQLTPVLEKFDRVATILTDNEKNLKETIDRLGPFANTLGEAVASGPNFDSLVGLNSFGDYTATFLNALRGRYPQVWQSLMYTGFPLIPDYYKLGPPRRHGLATRPAAIPDLSHAGADHERAVNMTIGRKVLLGVLAVVLVIALVVVGWTVFLRSTTNTFTAYFGSVASLYEGDPVRVLGVNVGRVSKITPPRENDVKVELRVDKSVDIPEDAKAVIVAQSLVSGAFRPADPPGLLGRPGDVRRLRHPDGSHGGPDGMG